MRKLIGILIIAVLFISCNDKSKNQRILFDSEGRINDISVVIDNENWKGRLGEAIRNILTEPVYGLPQDEPIFNINQIPPQVFTDFITRTRTVLKIEMGKKAGMVIRDNVYAKPQKVIVITGKTKDEIITILNENSAKIIETFRKIELAERQNQMRKALYNSKVITEKLVVSIEFPNAYRIAKEDDDFFWIRRDIRTGTLNLMLYELPYGAIKKTDSVVNKIVAIRDSIGQKYIEGPVEGSYMSTEMAYTPFHGETILDNKPTLETKGMWQVKNAFMAGPYINYAIEDKLNKRWIVAEGFAFAPSVEKRDYMFELEAIIKTIEIGN